MGPSGPIWAPTRTGPQPGLGPGLGPNPDWDLYKSEMFLYKATCFLVSPHKTMQNHVEIVSTSQFRTRNVRNWTKTLTSVRTSRTSPGGQVLVSKAFFFSRNYTFPILISKFISFMKSYLLLSKFMIFQ